MDHKRGDTVQNLALASLAGQAGCLTASVVLLALGAGLLLDSVLGTRPACTLGLILFSIPLSLVVTLRVMLSSVGAIGLSPPRMDPLPRFRRSRSVSTSTQADKPLTKENGS